MIYTGYPDDLLKAFEEMEIKEKYIKIELLDWEENVQKEIQGLVTPNGNVNVDGSSTTRRTCNFTIILIDSLNTYELEQIAWLNKKFRLYTGYKNNLRGYEKYGEKLWFKMGVFVFTSANFSSASSGVPTLSVTGRDKMCLLDGTIKGTLPDTIIHHENAEYEPVIIYDIVQELVNHYGQEPMQNIFINDIPDHGKMLMKYNGTRPIYLYKDKGAYTGNWSFNPPSGDYKKFEAGENIGYKITPLTYAGELISNVGESITSVLDKIISMLGNFEYFYDIDGHFVFQEKRNYLNTMYVPLTELEDGDYIANFGNTDISYSFKDTKLVNSYANTPNWENIKNDFVVWGKRELPNGFEQTIHYHLAIDDYPEPDEDEKNLDYREVLYRHDQNNTSTASWYKMEMTTSYEIDGVKTDEWRRLYTGTDWVDAVRNDPRSLTYFLEFIDGSGQYGKYSVSNIGRRTYAVEDDDVTCIYHNEIPEIVWVEDKETADNLREEYNYTCSVYTPQLDSAMVISSEGKSCFDVVREALYQHVSLQESITLNAIPVLYLEPNDKIYVEDERSNIFGNYLISSISIPLDYGGLMNLSAIRAETRI